ncbi:MAG: YdcF family protein [Pseudolabrys sp.]
MTGSDFDRGTGETPAPARRPPRRWLRRLGWFVVAAALTTTALFGFGFVWFVWSVANDEVALAHDADGIVVLTGGASRVADAIELMAAGRGRRLLISGLHRTTTVGEIQRLNPDFSRVIRCCVDYDHSRNTLGNAIETKRWAEDRGFHSIIVVTSNYHMPRAMAEIAHQLPDVELVPYPVITAKQRAEPWWRTSATARLMAFEYVKFLFAKLRMEIMPNARPETLAALVDRLRVK